MEGRHPPQDPFPGSTRYPPSVHPRPSLQPIHPRPPPHRLLTPFSPGRRSPAWGRPQRYPLLSCLERHNTHHPIIRTHFPLRRRCPPLCLWPPPPVPRTAPPTCPQ